MNYWLFVIPFLSAFTGWLIHSLAIRLFIQNILPRKKKELAQSIAAMAAKEFARFTGFEDKINDPKSLESILPLIETHIDTFLNERLKQEMPVIGMFIGNKTTDKLKEVFMKEIQVLFPQVIGQYAGHLKSSIDIGDLITKRIVAMSPADLQSIVRNNLAAELTSIRLLGAVAGFIIGLLQVLILLLQAY